MKISGKYNNIVIIQCYAPTTSHSDDTVANFCTLLQDIINNVSKRDLLFVNGDFNAKIGGLHTLEPNTVVQYNNISRGCNDRDSLLVDICKQNSLIVANTLFKHRHQWTCKVPGDQTRKTIGFILARTNISLTLTYYQHQI